MSAGRVLLPVVELIHSEGSRAMLVLEGRGNEGHGGEGRGCTRRLQVGVIDKVLGIERREGNMHFPCACVLQRWQQ